MDTGELVPDEIVIRVVDEHFAAGGPLEDGFILDGFPRTLVQAEELEQVLAGHPLDLVLDIEVPTETILDRIAGRRVCASCGATYHVNNRPEGRLDLRRVRRRRRAARRRHRGGGRPTGSRSTAARPSRSSTSTRSSGSSSWSTAYGERRRGAGAPDQGDRRALRRPAGRDHPQERRADRARCGARARSSPRCTRCASGPPCRARPRSTSTRWRARCSSGAGARSNFLGYHGFPAVVCTSPNEVIVHGIPSDDGGARRRATSSRSTAGRSSRAGTPTPR